MKPNIAHLAFALFATFVGASPIFAEGPGPAGAALRGDNRPLFIPINDDPNIVGNPSSALAVKRSEPATWLNDYDAALAQAAIDHKLVLLFFTGSDWCSPCRSLEGNVFEKPEFQEKAPARFVLVKIDFPQRKQLPPAEAAQNARLQRQYGVTGYPTVVIVDAQGQKLVEAGRYWFGGPAAYLAHLDRQLSVADTKRHAAITAAAPAPFANLQLRLP